MAAIAEAEVLFLDCGNSRCKYRMGEHSGYWLSIDTALATIDRWQPVQVLIASVSAFGVQLRDALVVAGRCKVNLIKVRNGWHGVELAYPDPERYGVDRWLTLIALREYQQNAVIVDAGTALTIDAIDSDGKHLGGYIMPGLTLMRRALVNDTFALPDVAASQSKAPGNNTADAIANGALLALSAAVAAAWSEYALSPCRLIWTGGDAPVLAGHVQLGAEQIPDLVFAGMRQLYKDAAYMESLG
ncbi:type III pantothenate kinase [Saccharospirillum impatiens]|uniref:type III pantothenate kinase n=1 Tax=Saccharospirillum impatiens TaxID=169438 RepID=UPI000402A173|nr:type III pantothenate kinase [Saccharospirillum impatiens]